MSRSHPEGRQRRHDSIPRRSGSFPKKTMDTPDPKPPAFFSAASDPKTVRSADHRSARLCRDDDVGRDRAIRARAQSKLEKTAGVWAQLPTACPDGRDAAS